MSHREKINLGGQDLIIETGRLAKQASGSAWVQLGDTVILATVVGDKKPVEGKDFFPLSVEYREKAYAVGKIPGGFLKREGRPSDQEILSARLIDRPIRPSFPEGYMNEVQVMVQVLSSDRQNDADVLGITGASLALSLSDIPFLGPIAGARVGRVNGEFIINPTYEQKAESDIDLVLAASMDSILMVEGEAYEVSEEDMLAALDFGHEQIKKLCQVQSDFAEKHGLEKMEFKSPEDYSELISKTRELCGDEIHDCFKIADKAERGEALGVMSERVLEALAEEYPEMEGVIGNAIHDYEKEIIRAMILDKGVRIDGRGVNDIRDITIETDILPRAHGSALFTRGQTQSLGVCTLGTKIDEQRIEGMEGEFWKNYMLHYNFPPFSTGEVKPMRGVSRREVGHGNLAERAIKPVIPADGVFPYTIRLVSEILESNGSSSMASVCSCSLALMQAGVPIKSHIAGIAMGLIKEDDRVAVLTDILGDEDHFGDMDFKVAGNREGITAFQMDIKINGISTAIMKDALESAKNARFFILDKMEGAIQAPNEKLSQHAPRIETIKILPDQIGAVIGPGGKTIREITETTGATVNIDDDGTVTIASVDSEACDAAVEAVKLLTATPELNEIYEGPVKKITNFGAFVEILPGKEGLLHISNIANKRINKVEDVLKVGDVVKVKLMKIEANGKLDLNRKVLLEEENAPDEPAKESEQETE